MLMKGRIDTRYDSKIIYLCGVLPILRGVNDLEMIHEKNYAE